MVPGKSTARSNDYSMALAQYGIYAQYMGWEDLGHILGAGKENEAKESGASIQWICIYLSEVKNHVQRNE